MIAASGDVDAEALVARLDELFRRLGSFREPGTTDEAAGLGPARPEAAAASPGWWTIDQPGPQAALAIGHLGAVFDSWDHPDRWALMLLTEILDGPGAVSRLRSRLQLELGLTYRVLTYFDLDVRPAGEVPGETPSEAPPHGSGEFRVFLETGPESAATAAAVVLGELRRLLRDEASEREIAVARQSLLARLPLLFDRAEAIAGRYAEDELLGRPHEYWAVYRERLLAVAAADIQGAARRFLDPEGVAVLVVGDLAAVGSGGGRDWVRLRASRARPTDGRRRVRPASPRWPPAGLSGRP